MVYTDGSDVMIDGVILPGLLKSIEVTTAAEIEEQDVEGSTAKPKQATGYEDGKISLELILIDSSGKTKEEKLQVIQDFFRQRGQDIPAVHSIINKHTAQRHITQVLFKNLVSKETNANDQLTVTLEFWEYVPMTISITTAAAAGDVDTTDTGANLNADYEKYLQYRGQAPKQKLGSAIKSLLQNRGQAQKQTDKTSKTPAKDG